VRLLAFAVLSAALMVVDARFETLKPVRSQLGSVLTPFYWLADLPVRVWDGISDQFTSRSVLIAENEKLKAEALLMQRRLQKLAALTEQNVRLRELLNSSALVDEKVLVGELIGVDPNPFTHRILIDKGEKDGVFLGQPVLDARGLMGQVVEVMPYTSRVLLLTDTTHSIPVQVNRNGLRAIASGTGNPERLELRHVADTADIKEGDLLVSSGMGQRFPAGYPVATVKEVIHDSGQPFAIVRAVPTAADVQHVVGGGISGVVAGREVHVGSPAFIAARADGAEGWLARLEDPTLTPVLVAVDGAVVAIAGLGDKVRDDTAAALAALRVRGWRTVLCSGDDPRVAEAVGRALGFGPDEILGGATPEAKRALVEHRRAAGVRPVVMVGDGVNDAAAIAAADVGIGVHGGAEASLASADAYLTTPGLVPLVAMVDGSARTMRVIRRNIAFALGYNAIGVALAMLGVLSPLIAAVMMPASSVTVGLASWLGRSFAAPARAGAASHDPAITPIRAAA